MKTFAERGRSGSDKETSAVRGTDFRSKNERGRDCRRVVSLFQTGFLDAMDLS